MLECRSQLDDSGCMSVMDKFSPQNLDNESEEFKDRLNFLNGCISFQHDQVNVFFREMQKIMGPEDPAGDDKDNEAQEQS